jgi:uncharacterized protein YbaA (DUF1428 family)
MKYVDGFVVAVPKKNVAAYRSMSQKAGKLWREHGALEYRECVGESAIVTSMSRGPRLGPIGDDLKVPMGLPSPRLAKLKRGETVFFSWIVYKSRVHRDSVNKKVMKDPRMAKMMNMKSMPFDVKRMAYGGFEVLVDV